MTILTIQWGNSFVGFCLEYLWHFLAPQSYSLSGWLVQFLFITILLDFVELPRVQAWHLKTIINLQRTQYFWSIIWFCYDWRMYTFNPEFFIWFNRLQWKNFFCQRSLSVKNRFHHSIKRLVDIWPFSSQIFLLFWCFYSPAWILQGEQLCIARLLQFQFLSEVMGKILFH